MGCCIDNVEEKVSRLQEETSMMVDKIKEAESTMDVKCHDLFLNKEILAPILKCKNRN